MTSSNRIWRYSADEFMSIPTQDLMDPQNPRFLDKESSLSMLIVQGNVCWDRSNIVTPLLTCDSFVSSYKHPWHAFAEEDRTAKANKFIELDKNKYPRCFYICRDSYLLLTHDNDLFAKRKHHGNKTLSVRLENGAHFRVSQVGNNGKKHRWHYHFSTERNNVATARIWSSMCVGVDIESGEDNGIVLVWIQESESDKKRDSYLPSSYSYENSAYALVARPYSRCKRVFDIVGCIVTAFALREMDRITDGEFRTRISTVVNGLLTAPLRFSIEEVQCAFDVYIGKDARDYEACWNPDVMFSKMLYRREHVLEPKNHQSPLRYLFECLQFYFNINSLGESK